MYRQAKQEDSQSCLKLNIRFHTQNIIRKNFHSFTYDHRTLKIRLPVRSAIYKQCTGGLVVRWVTTSESPLLYVFGIFFASKESSCNGWLWWMTVGSVELVTTQCTIRI
jgi:hypothetical protein